MLEQSHSTLTSDPNPHSGKKLNSVSEDVLNNCQVIRRNGKHTPFDSSKITVALTKAFLAVEGNKASSSTRVHSLVSKLSEQIVSALFRRDNLTGLLHIEEIQDQVELALMRSGEHKVARAYVLYREEHLKKRKDNNLDENVGLESLNYTTRDGKESVLDLNAFEVLIEESVKGIEDVDKSLLLDAFKSSLYDGIKQEDIESLLVLNARKFIDKEPNYSFVASRLLLNNLRCEALRFFDIETNEYSRENVNEEYCGYFIKYVQGAIELNLLDEELGRFNLEKLSNSLKPERDLQFNYLGLQTLYDRYFIHSNDTRIELPQAFFMRVAMGLAINEIDREERAIEFYLLLSSFNFMSSTPTLFNSGTPRPQLSSCYLTTVPDDLFGIYDSVKDNAMLSKYAGGLGNDWTPVRGMGSYIKGTNGKSQGVIPFLKVANDTAVAVNQGGKRKGAVCAYLETWHIDIEDFLELRKNTGDERRRTHDMNSANWIPDLFMERVVEDKEWTLFSPEEVPELHDLSGNAFKEKYEEYELLAEKGSLNLARKVKAVDLWRKMLGMLFETGHPWITFKDPCNVRYTNQHKGVVHSSNLCTEITLHTNLEEIAVCNLGSVNLAQHINNGELNKEKLKRTIQTAMRMLDNVIEYNYYSVASARNSNLKHRPVGLGIMGFQDALYQLEIPYASKEAVTFADLSSELISYFAIDSSSDLAKERGVYSSFVGSLWSQGILPIDSVEKLKNERGNYFTQDNSTTLDWQSLREKVKTQGIRNSNCLAIAPTATISNICGVSQSIEPTYQNLYVKSNLSGEFSVFNPYLVMELKKLNLWDEVMVNDLKYFDGSIQNIDRIPESLKEVYQTAFEIDSRWLIEAASRRQKWLDQAQSLNLYLAEASGKKLDQLYKLAWVRGLKTTYYLRSLGATQVEKMQSNLGEGTKDYSSGTHNTEYETSSTQTSSKVCSILEPDCEACQ